MINYTAEAFGTAMLILFGDGVVANVLLSRSKGESSGWIVITFGWGVAVMVAVYAVGRLSGAHLNPAVTLALASIGAFPWSDVPGYIAAQMIGALAGAVLVWLMYLPHWAVTQNADLKLAVFCTGPAIRKLSAELVDRDDRDRGVRLRGARDRRQRTNAREAWRHRSLRCLQQRFAAAACRRAGAWRWLVARRIHGLRHQPGAGSGTAHRALPAADSGKRDSDWGYAWIPIVGPLVGGVIGAQLFKAVGF
jgi:glycerol uptake facilitator protein